jgi:2-polyprenyl-6-methoxyphenol hydroxylase-like FAD-dependent oxidoreductase
VIAKGALDELRRAGLAAFHDRVRRLAGPLADRAAEVTAWSDVKLLTVRVARARRWYRDGFLCIGDAAHAMSPLGGVGINLAIQDAVAAANVLAGPLREARLAPTHLARVERRRRWPAQLTQRMQLSAQDRVIARVLRGTVPLRPPRALRLLARSPALRRLAGRLLGLGLRPEHVRTPAIAVPRADEP